MPASHCCSRPIATVTQPFRRLLVFPPELQQVQLLDDSELDMGAESGSERSEAVPCYENAAHGGLFSKQEDCLFQQSIS